MKLRNLWPCLAAILAALCVANAARGSEVWVSQYSSYGSNKMVIRYDMNGCEIGNFTPVATGGIYSMEVVGNQVWLDHGSGGILRYDQSGNYLGTITGDTFTASTIVGNQVWAYGQQGNIYEYSFGGTLLGQFAAQAPISGLAQVGNQVWATHGLFGIDVYGLNGDYLYSLLQNQGASAIAVAGGKVWVAAGDHNVNFYDTAGNPIGGFDTFGTGYDTEYMSAAGDEVWMTGGGLGYAAFDAAGQIVAGPYASTGGLTIVEVPEPASITLLGIGLAGVILRRRRRSR